VQSSLLRRPESAKSSFGESIRLNPYEINFTPSAEKGKKKDRQVKVKRKNFNLKRKNPCLLGHRRQGQPTNDQPTEN
jgi:hypothetical protein